MAVAADSVRHRVMSGRAIAWARENPLFVGAAVIGLAARIVTWAVTDRRLDDALITLKHDKNVAAGVGLIAHLGEPHHVQGFTSVLSVLVPLPGELVADGGGLLLIRLVSLAAFVLTVYFAYRIAEELELGPWPTGFALAYLALDMNQILFGVAGMETQIAVAVLLGGVYYVMRGDYTRSGIALGLALLARPDFVLWVAPAYAYLLIRDRRRALNAGLISLAILAPWVIFTTAYYGSPIPNTIIAKSQVFAPTFPSFTQPWDWISFSWDQIKLHSHDWTLLAPFFERIFVQQTPFPIALIKAVAFSVGLLAIAGAASTWKRASWRPAIVTVALYVFYKLVVLGFGYVEWYSAPPLALIFLLAAAGLDRVTKPVPRAAIAGACALALLYVIQLPFMLPLDQRTQRIESQIRQPMGQYLGRVVKPGQSLASESAGYVGYYTNGELYDYPGLTSARVVDAFKDAGPLPTLQQLVALLHPDWVVMRPLELAALQERYPRVAARYKPVRRFREPHPVTSLDHWGVHLLNVDQDFTVLRRQPARAGTEGQ